MLHSSRIFAFQKQTSKIFGLNAAITKPTRKYCADIAGGSIGIGNRICVVLAHMHPHDLTRLSIHSEKSLVVYDLYRLGIGIDLPVIGQNVFNDERHRLGGYILEKVFLLLTVTLLRSVAPSLRASSTWCELRTLSRWQIAWSFCSSLL